MNTIARKLPNDLFLLGAGFSFGMYPLMPLMNDLTATLADQPAVQRWEHLGNIEEVLTYLSQSLPWEGDPEYYRKRADFFEITRLISAEISHRQSNIPADDIADHPMTPLVRRWHEDQVDIITLNYDTLVEVGLQLIGDVHYTDYFPVPLVDANSRDGGGLFGTDETATATVYKLHGSVDWYYSGNESFYGESIYIGSKPLDPVAGNQHRFLFDKVSLIVPPTFEKSNFFKNETIRAVWRLAGHALQRADRVFIVGYSLPESDLMMRYFLQANVIGKKKKEIILVDPSTEVCKKFQRYFKADTKISQFVTTNFNPARAFAAEYGNRII
jgi:hypothetical protein